MVRRGIVLLLVGLGLVAPLVPLAIWSVSARWFFPALLPTELSPRAWQVVLAPTSDVAAAFSTSLVVAGAATVLSTILGLAAGRALGSTAFRGKRLAELLFLLPLVVPPIAVALGLQATLIRIGLADSIVGVVLVHLVRTVPYATLLMAATFANFDPDYEAQAQALGAGRMRTLWHVTLPLVAPGLTVAALFAFLVSWGEYLLTLLVGGGQVKTLPLLLFAYVGSDTSMAAALSLVLALPVVLALPLTGWLLGANRTAAGRIAPL